MTDSLYAMTQVHRIFNGTNVTELMDAVRVTFPNAVITASANYPGEDATVQVTTAAPMDGGYVANFRVGDSWAFGIGQFVRETLTDPYQMTALTDLVLTTVPVPALAVGYETTPDLTAGASATVQVPMVPALPDSGYNVAVALAGPSQLLGSLQILSHTVISANAVNVAVQNNNGSLTLGGATILVTALHNG